MKKILGALALILLVAGGFYPVQAQDISPGSVPVSTDGITGEHVEKFNAVVSVEGNGRLRLSETIVYDFGEAQRHGIFRKIPLKYNSGRDGISIQNISVVDGSDAPYRYEVYEENGYKVVKIGDPDVLISGVKTYNIFYIVDNAVQWGDEIDQIIWNVTGNEWEVPIQEAEVTVFPLASHQEFQDHAQFNCYQGPFGSMEPCKPGEALEDLGGFGRGFLSTRQLVPGEGLTFSLTLPKGLLVPPTPTERALKLLLEYWPLLLPVATAIFLFRRWWQTGRDPKGRGTVIAQYEPPAGLSPVETGTLLSGTVKPVYISAQIISLATRGFLKITPSDEGFGKPDDYILEKLKDPAGQDPFLDRLLMMHLFSASSALTKISDLMKFMAAMKGKSEEEALVALQASSTQRPVVKISELKGGFSKAIEALKGAVTQTLLQKGYYDRDPRKVFGPYLVTAFLIFFFSFFALRWWPLLLISADVSAVVIGIFGWIMPKVTKEGAIEKENIRGFRDYLDIAEKDRLNFHNAPEKRPELFEKFLPYALALGVVDAWAKEFKDIYLEPPRWYGGSATGPFLAAGIAHDLSRFSSVAGSTAFASGGSGSGGGFSGGGAGGGGGGSW